MPRSLRLHLLPWLCAAFQWLSRALSPAARENSPGVFPRPVFYISANTGRGVGRVCGSAASSPMRQSAALLRRDAHQSLGMEGVGGATPAPEGFFPHIRHESHPTQSRYQPPSKTPTIPNKFNIFSRFFLLRPEAQKKKAIKKENAEGFRRLRAATWGSAPDPAAF